LVTPAIGASTTGAAGVNAPILNGNILATVSPADAGPNRPATESKQMEHSLLTERVLTL
jgi:hypothetical protein